MKGGECTESAVGFNSEDFILEFNSAKDSCGFCGQIT